jgi:uncharacterized protein YyaL (SSP411 family)
MRLAALVLAAFVATVHAGIARCAESAGIAWVGWSDDVFKRAVAEKKLVLLDLEAVWCHWCHVMDEKTYADPKVRKMLADHYIAVKVDQDARPDLATRYEDYGWPATIVFKADGSELAKRSGYMPPESFLSMLQAFVDNPVPGPSVRAEPDFDFAASPILGDDQRQALKAAHDKLYDAENVGWAQDLKYLEWRSAEYALERAHAGDKQEAERLKATLAKEATLIDPVWGGVYQYSDGGVWTHPHFEKIMQYQSENMRIFALAYALFGDAAYLQAAKDVEKFVRGFLTSPEGAFYTSMDADAVKGEHSAAYFKLDDAGRRKRGLPRIDKNVYARENGWMIQALAQLYAASGDATFLAEATKAAEWIQAHRALGDGGGYRHGESDAAGPFLGDTLAMGRAWLALYLVTGDRAQLARAEKSATFIAQTFAPPAGKAGYVAAKASTTAAAPKPTREENLDLARFANLLYRVTGDAAQKTLAETAFRFPATKGIADKLPTAGVLLVERELTRDPTHVTVVGAKGNERARALFQTAVRYPSSYKRVEWWDKSEGQLRHQDVRYPDVKDAAAFACSDQRCSLPITKPDALLAKVEDLMRTKVGP